ncbi:gas vesicle protein GvpG [Desulforhopalus vacuolatus]|uniref:gas vesicle protein GvpG n=1 Tax=Desulforhopalus vacuolatus TaxID=40414 RepID=UPI001963F82E|nr:gas vesicle protein GvpG [Desulforhopalus vacuolatus]MBM9521174.1 gas vesicle protein GvpG [Desulforhopalus vacuolatus]
MILVDDILLSPVRGLLWVFKEISNAVQQEIDGEAENITAELSELYMMLDIGNITEDEFDAREKELLDRLDEIEAQSEENLQEEDESDGEVEEEA